MGSQRADFHATGDALACSQDVDQGRIPLIIESLETDDQVRHLSLASEVSKLMQHDWDTCLRVARDPQTAPEPRKLPRR